MIRPMAISKMSAGQPRDGKKHIHTIKVTMAISLSFLFIFMPFQYATADFSFRNAGHPVIDRNGDVLPLRTVDLKNGFIDTQPVVYNGRIYVLTGGIMDWTTKTIVDPPHLWCLSTDGDVIWKTALNDTLGYELCTPAIMEDRIYVLTSGGTFYAIGMDGTIVWERKLSTGPETSSPLVYNNSVVVLLHNGTLLSVDRNGAINTLGTFQCSVYYSSPVVYNHRIFFGTDNGTVVITGQDGIHTVQIGGRVRTSGAITPLGVLISSENGENTTCALIDSRATIVHVWNFTGKPSSPSYMPGFFVVPSGQVVHFISEDTFETMLSIHVNGPVGGMTTTPGRVYLTTNVNTSSAHSSLYVIHHGKSEVFPLRPYQWCLSTPGVGNGIVAVGSDSGHLHIFAIMHLEDEKRTFTIKDIIYYGAIIGGAAIFIYGVRRRES